ncbi:hypothetical protein FHL15_000909 [Xylaria flabelliformis]|uniref:Uncharacterized protein n=1 Tax=Xylaria flabelliformis TaxID=2512241 RepID=A0A553IDJ2_9PEZI|nr:hypothetical protein FHL15_000909 [Xylaria flabelliformis]
MAIKRLVIVTFLMSAAEGLLSRESIRDDKLSSPYMSNITWTGLIDKNSGQMSFTGLSLQQIHEQIREINPNFSWSRKIGPESQDSWDEDRGNILCDMAWDPKFASVFHIRQVGTPKPLPKTSISIPARFRNLRSTETAQMARDLETALVSRARTDPAFGFAMIIRILRRYPAARLETELGT